jgi:transcriptional regulator with XRE-family HTH domain
MVNDQQQSSPELYKAQLGEAVKRCREQAGKLLEDAAEVLGCSTRKIRTIEKGEVAIRAAELRDLLDLYGVTGQDRADLEHLAALARQRRPRTPWGSAVPDRLKKFFAVEETAVRIDVYQPYFLHGLVQTADYARAVIRTNSSLSAPEVDRLVEARLARQARLTSPHPPAVLLVIDEHVLRSRVGGPAVMRRQLEELHALGTKDFVEVRVIPTEVGAHAGNGVAFLLLTPAGDRPRLPYVETLTDGLFVDEPARIERYETVMREMLAVAISHDASLTLMDTVAAQL